VHALLRAVAAFVAEATAVLQRVPLTVRPTLILTFTVFFAPAAKSPTFHTSLPFTSDAPFGNL
jgi:hypothetical protein